MTQIQRGTDQTEGYLLSLLDAYQAEHFAMDSVSQTYTLEIFVEGKRAGGILWQRLDQVGHVKYLAVEPDFRRLGLGAQLMQAVEAEARELNLRILSVNTQDYQGLNFYPALGYEVVGQIKDYPLVGTTKYFLKKEL
ncbi:hypothetical protein RU97_GL000996 [Enterococcus canis]|uniref:N-acetyltransferase domain-containing protein n=1 Tax=Enterococcus canis TaxID=214095 RepID=A0A1L8RI90_9ENTE|nr:GNAT family N-acetyltransferase [Enterococcus canis]OJG19425.1 hypothetical protein RU97_GL000996 [Enterococcus canis]